MPISVRVLGGVLNGEKVAGGSLVLVIGGSASRCLNSGVPVKVLYRNSSAWDDHPPVRAFQLRDK
jgi:hypothetical protein